MFKSRSLPILAGAAIAAAFLAAAIPQAQAANIITFDDNATACGGSTLCSTNGTTGYLDDGTGVAFDLSTINSWFQINTETPPINRLPATQTEAEPKGGAGDFLVVNDTGSTVTSFSLTLFTTFTSATDNFQAGKGAAAPSGAGEALSGPDFYKCTNPNLAVGVTPCSSTAGQAAADFTPNMITYDWFGLDIAPGADFQITFSSFNNSVFVPAPEIDHGPFVLLAVGGVLFGARLLHRSKTRRSLGAA